MVAILNSAGDLEQFRAEQEILLQQFQKDYGIALVQPELLRPNPKRANNQPINEFIK
ncbi:MAG: hypothetical protein HC792_02190 [Acaryochloridaceae cyanobacterium CSU_5_19]|nr:hypothetical protein [Acaryochloridaceae cyanobacterium CSU_5_19]